MTLSGSKVEITEDLGAEISNVVVGRILSMERHPDSDHMWICQIDVGQAEPIQIVTGAWNIHVGDLVPVALHKSTLPGGKKIEKGKLRGVVSNGMLCGLYELGLDERDFPYAVITPAAMLNDYHPLDKDKPSIPADIQPGDKVFGPVVCAKILEACQPAGRHLPHLSGPGRLHRCARHRLPQPPRGGPGGLQHQDRRHLHPGRSPRRAEGVPPLHPRRHLRPPRGACRTRRRHQAQLSAPDDHVVEFEITPNRPDCLSVIGLAREAAATYDAAPAPPRTGGQGRRRRRADGAAGRGDPGRRAVPPVHRPDGAQREDRPLPQVDAGAAAEPWACAPSTTSWTSPTMSCWSTASPCTPLTTAM